MVPRRFHGTAFAGPSKVDHLLRSVFKYPTQCVRCAGTAYGANGFVDRPRVSGENPIGAASCRQQCNQASCHTHQAGPALELLGPALGQTGPALDQWRAAPELLGPAPPCEPPIKVKLPMALGVHMALFGDLCGPWGFLVDTHLPFGGLAGPRTRGCAGIARVCDSVRHQRHAAAVPPPFSVGPLTRGPRWLGLRLCGTRRRPPRG